MSETVAVVVMDTLRKDTFDEHFEWLPGARYEHAWSTSHWTVPAHASLFTGRYPSEHGVHAKNPILDYPGETLAEAIRAEGKRSCAFSSNLYISGEFKFDRGFDEFSGSWRLSGLRKDIFDWKEALNPASSLIDYPRAIIECLSGDCDTAASLRHGWNQKMRSYCYFGPTDDGAQATLDYIKRKSLKEVDFLFLNLMEAHAPYLPPREYRTVDNPTTITSPPEVETDYIDASKIKAAYHDSVRYLSDVYREIFSSVEKDFDYVITLADHGEHLGEYGLWGHEYGVRPPVTHIPLVISGSNGPDRPSTPVSILDVPATVAEILDIEFESRGKYLLSSKLERNKCLTEFNGLRRSLVKNQNLPRPVSELDTKLRGVALEGYYGFESNAIRDEPMNEWTEEGKIDADGRKKLAQMINSLDIRKLENKKAGISESTANQLEDLGYV